MPDLDQVLESLLPTQSVGAAVLPDLADLEVVADTCDGPRM